ncbi:Hypothetical protein SRAE_X000137900 [Strongyloides ratti]|uniref:Uncharacterized protein n=1 Tax=Strongyloides ratti TaxID=34506 RepID=A0A090KQ24_STRRB|nr:Hypothetical protein SRAE_X000137900 [Strongyloides ratti]CEF59633.2 Hypothetical protein SRAE_X000137900 [Strongyloides ratti]
MNFSQLSEKIVDEKAAVKFFQSHGIISEEKECSKKHQMKLQFGKQIRWRCYIKESRNEPQYNCGFQELPPRGMSVYGREEPESYWREGKNSV